MAENIGPLLRNTIGTRVEKVDDEVFESRMAEVFCLTLKKRSAVFTVAH